MGSGAWTEDRFTSYSCCSKRGVMMYQQVELL